MSKQIKQLNIGGNTVPIINSLTNGNTKGYYIYSVSGKVITLSTSRPYDSNGNSVAQVKPNANILARWAEPAIYDAYEIANQYVSYDAGVFYSLARKVMSVDTAKGTITLDLTPQGTLTASALKNATGTDYTIYLPQTPDAGEVDLFSNQLQQGECHAAGNMSVAINRETNALGPYSFAAGKKTTAGYGAAAFGQECIAQGNHSFAAGTNSNATNLNAAAFGHGNISSGEASFSIGHVAEARGTYSFAQGNGTIATGESQAVFGRYNVQGDYAFAIGWGGSSSERKNLVEIDRYGNANFFGNVDAASVYGSKFISSTCSAAGSFASALGNSNTASGTNSFVCGNLSTASGGESAAFGYSCTASGNKSMAIGMDTEATGHSALSMGQWTIASGVGQLALGKYNASDTSKYLVIGNGSSDTARVNVFSVATNGAMYSAGTLTFNGSNVISKVHTLNITYTDGTTSTIKVAGVN